MSNDRFRELQAYEMISDSRIDEIAADSVVMKHRKTGARVFVLPCEDDNKVFTIGFRTPPADSTGVAHIIEHTVLCGSEKYPAKDPFIELAKGSLNTFLNAMTYPDKTLYPVASCNNKDFENLISVYLDAVFNPNIYKEEKIFRQEGWHYELESEDGELKYNGVVYNEMKGVYSSADAVLDKGITDILFAGTTYGEDSGGNPEHIPELTYEQYLDFHRRYYHPSNAFIYLYGNADIPALLEKIDREYLSHYERKEIDSFIPVPAVWTKPVERELRYSVSAGETEETSSYLSVASVVDAELDPIKYTAFQILDYLMLSVPGAPVEEALIRAGIGEEIFGGFCSGIRMPYFSINAKNADARKKEDFLRIVREVLADQAEHGIDKEAIQAAINITEFKAREADYGSFPKGLLYGIASFDSWLYDADPTMHLRYDSIFRRLRELSCGSYFENLIKEYLIDNPYTVVLTVKPERGHIEKQDALLKEKLAGYKASLSTDEIKKLIYETAELKKYQSEPSSREDLLKIPMLKRQDICQRGRGFRYELRDMNGCRTVFTDVFTSGIAYIRMYYDLRRLAPEDIPYAAFIASVLGDINTRKHTYSELSTIINMNSGGVDFGIEGYPDEGDPEKAVFAFKASAKVLYDKTDFAFTVLDEILKTSRLDDVSRIKELAAEERSAVRDAIQESGHQTALNRAGSHISGIRWFLDNVKGIEYYKMLEHFDAEQLSAKICEVSSRIFSDDNLIINIICDEDGYSKAADSFERISDVRKCTDKDAFKPCRCRLPDGPEKEIFTTSSLVNFSARTGNFRRAGFEKNGYMEVLKVILNYDYLWNNVRVLGGAYGCSSVFATDGVAGFTSFRDPKLFETDAVYRKIPDYVEKYDADERELTKSVIGAISSIDMPLTPLAYGSRSFAAYISGTDPDKEQQMREEILNVTSEDIRKLAPLMRVVIDENVTCSIAGESMVEEINDREIVVRPLIEDKASGEKEIL